MSWRPGLKDSEIRSRSVSPIPSYYVGSNNPESPNQQGSESFSELEGDMPEQAMFEPKNASAASSLSPLNPQGIPSLTHNKVTVMPPRITTNFLDLPGSVQEPISPPLLRAYQGGHSRGESLGLGLSTLSSSQQPTLRRDEVLKELLSPIATTTMSSRQELGIGAPIVSRITLPPNSKLGKGPIEKRETSEDISKETFKSKNPRTSIPSRPLLCLPPSPSPAYNCSSGLVSSPENMDETDAKVGMRNDRARRSGLRSFHNGLDEKEPVPMQPASMTARRVSREFGAKHVIERYPGASVSTTTAVPPRGRRHGSIAGGSWATRNPLNGVRRSGSYRNVDDNGSPMTPVDFEVAQRQRLRSDSTASTIAGSEYDLCMFFLLTLKMQRLIMATLFFLSGHSALCVFLTIRCSCTQEELAHDIIDRPLHLQYRHVRHLAFHCHDPAAMGPCHQLRGTPCCAAAVDGVTYNHPLR